MNIEEELTKAAYPAVIHPTLMEKLVKRVEEMVSSGRGTALVDLEYIEDLLTDPVEDWNEWESGSDD